ncbi:hypothetical protein ABLE91_16870 [Aquabacter sp. CN5-332]|uniref:hypothetical protein n=1 Tax=Aquabacter sp. CN5-332 TaxID=3156608 RepID=UPI0032B31FAF
MGWDDELAAADAAVAGYFDTLSFTAVGMTRPPRASNAAAIVDPARPAFGFLGTLESAPEFTSFADSNRPTAGDRSVRQITRICLTALTTGWPWVPRQDDRIRSAVALYQVAANPDCDGTARVAIWLNKVSS